jgi:SanA protein
MKVMSFYLYQALKYTIAIGAIGVITVLLLNGWVILSANSAIIPSVDELEGAEVVIILGAGVYQSGELTPILKDRVDTAIVIYRNGLVEKILVSGDNASKDYNEVVPVWEYLIAAGIPESDIFLDYAGFDTYDTMYRARDVFEVDSAIVVTQDFHLPRAVFLAQELNIEIQGLSPVRDKSGTFNSFREVLARVKAALDVIVKSDPTYLGESIPISGDGSETVGE